MMFKTKKMNKKGDIQDLITLIVVIVGFALAGILAYKFIGEFNDQTADSTVLTDHSKEILNDAEDRMPLIFDGGLLVVMVFFTIVMLISAWYVDTHPAIFVIAFILVIAIVIVAGALSTAFGELTQSPELIDQANEFPISVFVLGNLPLLVFVIGVALIIVLFAKYKNQRGT